MKRSIFSLLLLLGTISAGWSAGLIVVDEAHWKHPLPPDGIVPPPWPSPRPPREPWPRPWPVPPPRVYEFCPLEITKHQATVQIKDQIAITAIDQDFYNPNSQRIEGTFLFPVPKGAQIKKFAMEIDGKPVMISAGAKAISRASPGVRKVSAAPVRAVAAVAVAAAAAAASRTF